MYVKFGSIWLKIMSENPNMKMLIDEGWRQSNVITGPNWKLVAQIFQ